MTNQSAPTPQSPTAESNTPQLTARSDAAMARARRSIPGGVNSPVRAFSAVGGSPRFIASGNGSHVTDIDGNTYVDLVCSWGPMIHGHAFPPVVEAVRQASVHGLSFGAPTEIEVELAEELIARGPAEQVRLVNSGTEATMSALRLARGATGRPKLLKFDGCYHGHADSLLVGAGSGVATLGIPGSPGVTPGAAADTLVVPYNDRAAVAAALAEHGEQIAAVITEACAGNMGTVAPEPGFNQFLADTAHRHGALLILDEVMTGFRASERGWFGIDGVEPDLVTYGKVISGGLPAAAFGGRAELMAQLAPEGPVYQAGTLSGNPVAVAAGLANLRAATQSVYSTLSANADRLEAQLRRHLSAAGVDHSVSRGGTMLSVFFAADLPRNFTEVQGTDTHRYAPFFRALLGHGVYVPPSAFETWFVSAALTDADFEQIDVALAAAASAAAATE